MHGYLGGENFRQVYERATRAIDEILAANEGGTVMVISHHIVNRTYLAGVIGLGPARARMISLDNCGISIVHWNRGKTTVATLNAGFHLQGVSV